MKTDNTFLENFYNEYDEAGRFKNNRLGKVEYRVRNLFIAIHRTF